MAGQNVGMSILITPSAEYGDVRPLLSSALPRLKTAI